MGAQVTPAVLRVPALRLPDWQMRLAGLVNDRAGQPFEWGVRDCCLWAADAVLAVTGHDPAAPLRGVYSSALQAGRVLRGTSIEALAEQALGEEIVPALAQAGDVGLVVSDEGPALVVQGGDAWLAQAAVGLAVVRPDAVLRAWRCTCHKQ